MPVAATKESMCTVAKCLFGMAILVGICGCRSTHGCCYPASQCVASIQVATKENRSSVGTIPVPVGVRFRSPNPAALEVARAEWLAEIENAEKWLAQCFESADSVDASVAEANRAACLARYRVRLQSNDANYEFSKLVFGDPTSTPSK